MNGNVHIFINGVTLDTELFEIIVKYFPDFKDEKNQILFGKNMDKKY